MSGELYVIATPIGNLEDLSLRAARLLKEVDGVAAEDTRRTGKLLQHLQVKQPMVSCHAHNERDRVDGIIRKLQAGEKWALVSDAGTPAVSDPGFLLVAAAHDAAIKVTGVPGPSSVVTALSISGWDASQFTMWGFVPKKKGERTKLWERIGALPHASVFLEAPGRVRKTLQELGAVLSREVVVCRELTKVHQEALRGTTEDVLAKLDPEPRGEFTVVIGPGAVQAVESAVPTIEALRAEGLGDKEIAKQLAAITGRSRRELYAEIISKKCD